MDEARGKSDDGAECVVLFGSGEPAEGEADYELARAVGRKLAELGYAVANGGYGGTMEASARGAAEGGSEAIGVTCSVWSARANPYCRHVIVTDTLAERVAVELGRASARSIEIVRGLNPGDRIVLSDMSRWEGKDRLRVE